MIDDPAASLSLCRSGSLGIRPQRDWVERVIDRMGLAGRRHRPAEPERYAAARITVTGDQTPDPRIRTADLGQSTDRLDATQSVASVATHKTADFALVRRTKLVAGKPS